MTCEFRSFAIVPACGESRRMGTDKLWLPWDGRTILETVLAAWVRSPVDKIVLVTGRRQASRIAECTLDERLELVLVDQPTADMKATVQLGLRHIADTFAPGEDDAWLLAPADMPTLSSRTIQAVLSAYADALAASARSIILPMQGQRRGHPALFPWSLYGQVSQLPEQVGLNTLVDAAGYRAVGVEHLGEDVDTIDQWRDLRGRHDPTFEE